ncbi:MAG: suppressor of fused domain protein [Hominimerdicola sp.]
MEEIQKLMDAEEYAQAVELILDIPQEQLTLQHLDMLACAYFNLGEYDLSLEFMKQQYERGERSCRWHYLTALILYAMKNYEDAQNLLEICISLNPPEELLQKCESMLAQIADKQPIHEGIPIMYDEEEMLTVEKHIEKYFGKFETVLHEIYSPDIHVDICVVPPTKERDYYILSTMGMGARKMNVPEELADHKLDRAELAICLPSDWKVNDEDEKWYWPIRLLKSLARLPISCDTWLGFAHTITHEAPYADNTALCGSILIRPQSVDDSADICVLPNGDEINFYFILPIYEQEMDFKLKFGANRLLRKMRYVDFVLDINRPDVCEFVGEDGVDMSIPLDDGYTHYHKIIENNFSIDEICGYNHMAIYLRWCIEHDLMSENFNEKFSDVINSVKKHDGKTDLRIFIQDALNEVLTYSIFNDKGVAFAKFYYGAYTGGNEEPFFPCDIDDYALKYFGEEEYNNPKYNTEAYLFIPFDENFYNGMAYYIDKHYQEFKNGLE